MGFEETVKIAAWEQYRPYYVKYNELKNLLQDSKSDEKMFERNRMTSDHMMDIGATPVGRFQAKLRAELHKVNDFACVKHEALFLGLRRLCDECKDLEKGIRSGATMTNELDSLSEKIEAAGQEISQLDTYVRLNYVGLQRITQKFDQVFGMTGSQFFMAGLHTEPFCNVRFDDILILLGLAWARWRNAQSTEKSKDVKWKPPESFVRNTSKYWVRPDQVVLLKTRIVKHLPYLIMDASEEQQEEKFLDPFALLDLDPMNYDEVDDHAMGAYTGTMEESQLLSSVYFDSPDAVSYQERIRREEGARLVRFRWYGENNMENDKEVFIERKIHHEGWGGAQSAKERGVLPQKVVGDFMSGKLNVVHDHYKELASDPANASEKAQKGLQKMKSICLEVDQMIQEKRLQPIIRTSYYRCAFQLATSNNVRISLDTQMSLLNEFREARAPDQHWCLTSSDKLSKEEIYRFPFAILEIKLQNVTETPEWLKETLRDIGAIQVHKFSKFQHSMAFLHPQRVPILPHWHQDFQDWHDSKERDAFGLQSNKQLSSILNSTAEVYETLPQIHSQSAPDGCGHHMKDMQNLDPKGIFANERTLLHYAEKGMYVGALAVVLCHQEGRVNKMMGLLLSVSTALFYCWAMFEYYSRLGRIVGRAKVGKDRMLRLDATAGPLIVGILVLCVVGITLVQAWRAPFEAAASSSSSADSTSPS